MMAERNWAGNLTYGAQRIHQPTSLGQLRDIVCAVDRIRVLGSRHSFNAIADSAELVSLRRLPVDLHIDSASATITCGASVTYGELAPQLHGAGVALANLASLPHISVGGAIATATHGAGLRSGNLASQVAALELVTSGGELMTLARGEPGFDGAVVGLGALGAVTRVTLDVEPTYTVGQHVYEDLSWRSLEQHFEAIAAAGDSVSLFTRWGESAGQLLVKRRLSARGAQERAPSKLFGARAAAGERHPIPGADPRAATAQLGRPGPWHERLPHFGVDFVPSAGDELQTEYHVGRHDAPAAIEALRRIAQQIAPLLHVSELRTVAADELWLSPQYRRDSLAIHFTWHRHQGAVERLLERVEEALEPFAPRPHWGKLFLTSPQTIAARYERLPDYLALIERIDPRGAFRNDWLEERVLAGLSSASGAHLEPRGGHRRSVRPR